MNARRRGARSAVRQAANRTLDLAREGAAIPAWAIVHALIETGDLDFADVPFMRHTRVPGSWERGDFGLLKPATWLDVIA